MLEATHTPTPEATDVLSEYFEGPLDDRLWPDHWGEPQEIEE